MGAQETELPDEHCVMYDICNGGAVHLQNCPTNDTAKVLTDTISQNVLFDRCPDFYKDGELFIQDRQPIDKC